MPSLSISKVILLIALTSYNTLSLPVKSEIPEFGDWFKGKMKPKSHLTGGGSGIFGPKYEYSPLVEDANQPPRPGCTNELLKILLPLKYRFENGLTNTGEDIPNIVQLPIVKQPYEKYKVLVATAPPGLELGEDSDKAMTIYVVFNDDRTYSSPMNLPTVYFVKKRPMSHNGYKDTNPILMIDSNRTVTGLRSKEIHKNVKFSKKVMNGINEMNTNDFYLK